MNTIDQILQSLPSREDLASAIGLESRSTMPDFLPALGLFGTGMLFGAGLALMFAPKSGSEMRRDLSEGMQQWGNQAMGGYGQSSYGGQQSQGGYGQSGYGSQQQGQMPSQAQRSQYGSQGAEHATGTGQHYQSSQGTEYGRQMAGQSESQRQMSSQGGDARTGTNPQHGTSRGESTGRSPIGGSSGSRNI